MPITGMICITTRTERLATTCSTKAEHWNTGLPKLRFVADDQQIYGGFWSLIRIAMQHRRKYKICANRYIKSFEY